jgi:methyltransferase
MSRSQALYLALLGAVVAERLVELLITRRNLTWARARGAREHGAADYPWMVATHVLFLIACPLEVVALDRPFLPPLGIPMLVLLGATMALRYWAIAALGRAGRRASWWCREWRR